MLKNVLTENLYSAISLIDINKLQEIRLRANSPVVVKYNSYPYFLSKKGISSKIEEAYKVKLEDLTEIIYKASNQSIYTVNDSIKKGYITTQGGVRIGVCGEVVYDEDNISTIKNFSSLNIRIPHQIKNCALNALPFIINKNKFYNTLVVSAPGAGKTTFLRDLVFQLSDKNYAYNVLILDERMEIANTSKGKAMLNVGNFADIYSNVSKRFGFENGIRSMAPDIIVTDEIANENDVESVFKASGCGVNVVASVHAENIAQLKQKVFFKKLIINKTFKRYVVLSNNNGVGTYEGIFDENFNLLLS